MEVTALFPMNGIRAIAATGNSSAVLLTSGELYAWGEGTQSKLPKLIASGLNDALAFAIGPVSPHYLVLKKDGSLWTLGNNSYGQLGDGTNANRTVPAVVPGMESGVTAIAAGSFYSLALKSDGSVWGWGENLFGKIGDNTETVRYSPVKVMEPQSGVIAITSGWQNSMALQSDGSVYGWGLNTLGQVGGVASRALRLPTSYVNSGVTSLVGTVEGLKLNAGSAVNWGRLYWSGIPGAVRFKTRGASTEAGLQGASWSSDYNTTSGMAITNPGSSVWLELKLELLTNGELDDFSVTY
jgi:alpha-tubulin suppressor-like RCC1 family protein